MTEPRNHGTTEGQGESSIAPLFQSGAIIILILKGLIYKCLHFKMLSSGLILGGHECLCATSKKRHLTRFILFRVNYC